MPRGARRGAALSAAFGAVVVLAALLPIASAYNGVQLDHVTINGRSLTARTVEHPNMFVIEKTSADVTFMLKVNITDAVAGSRFTGSWSQPDLSPSSGQAIVSFGLGRFDYAAASWTGAAVDAKQKRLLMSDGQYMNFGGRPIPLGIPLEVLPQVSDGLFNASEGLPFPPLDDVWTGVAIKAVSCNQPLSAFVADCNITVNFGDKIEGLMLLQGAAATDGYKSLADWWKTRPDWQETEKAEAAQSKIVNSGFDQRYFGFLTKAKKLLVDMAAVTDVAVPAEYLELDIFDYVIPDAFGEVVFTAGLSFIKNAAVNAPYYAAKKFTGTLMIASIDQPTFDEASAAVTCYLEPSSTPFGAYARDGCDKLKMVKVSDAVQKQTADGSDSKIWTMDVALTGFDTLDMDQFGVYVFFLYDRAFVFSLWDAGEVIDFLVGIYSILENVVDINDPEVVKAAEGCINRAPGRDLAMNPGACTSRVPGAITCGVCPDITKVLWTSNGFVAPDWILDPTSTDPVDSSVGICFPGNDDGPYGIECDGWMKPGSARRGHDLQPATEQLRQRDGPRELLQVEQASGSGRQADHVRLLQGPRLRQVARRPLGPLRRPVPAPELDAALVRPQRLGGVGPRQHEDQERPRVRRRPVLQQVRLREDVGRPRAPARPDLRRAPLRRPAAQWHSSQDLRPLQLDHRWPLRLLLPVLADPVRSTLPLHLRHRPRLPRVHRQEHERDDGPPGVREPAQRLSFRLCQLHPPRRPPPHAPDPRAHRAHQDFDLLRALRLVRRVGPAHPLQPAGQGDHSRRQEDLQHVQQVPPHALRRRQRRLLLLELRPARDRLCRRQERRLQRPRRLRQQHHPHDGVAQLGQRPAHDQGHQGRRHPLREERGGQDQDRRRPPDLRRAVRPGHEAAGRHALPEHRHQPAGLLRQEPPQVLQHLDQRPAEQGPRRLHAARLPERLQGRQVRRPSLRHRSGRYLPRELVSVTLPVTASFDLTLAQLAEGTCSPATTGTKAVLARNATLRAGVAASLYSSVSAFDATFAGLTGASVGRFVNVGPSGLVCTPAPPKLTVFATDTTVGGKNYSAEAFRGAVSRAAAAGKLLVTIQGTVYNISASEFKAGATLGGVIAPGGKAGGRIGLAKPKIGRFGNSVVNKARGANRRGRLTFNVPKDICEGLLNSDAAGFLEAIVATVTNEVNAYSNKSLAAGQLEAVNGSTVCGSVKQDMDMYPSTGADAIAAADLEKLVKDAVARGNMALEINGVTYTISTTDGLTTISTGTGTSAAPSTAASLLASLLFAVAAAFLAML